MRRRKTIDTPLIMDLGPCEDWPEDRVREAVPKRIRTVDFLRSKHIPPEDRLWVVLHPELCSDRAMRLFACDCAERALVRERESGREPDQRSWDAVEVAHRYAVGEATGEELTAAWTAARVAAWTAAWTAARAAAWTAAWTAAWAAAGAAARAAAGADEREWQCGHLAEMLTEEES